MAGYAFNMNVQVKCNRHGDNFTCGSEKSKKRQDGSVTNF